MNPLLMLREGGIGAWAALAFGMLALLLSVFALLTSLNKSRSAFGLGIGTLLTGTLAAVVGMLGTVHGRYVVDRAIANVATGIDAERILRMGWSEAANAALVGFFGAIVPLVIGAFAAISGAKADQPGQRIQGLSNATTTDEGSGRVVVAMIFAGITALAAGGAWMLSHQKPPAGRFDFATDDQNAWQLAAALENIDKNEATSCERLSYALEHYWQPTNRREWPRVMRGTIPSQLADRWKPAAKKCVERQLDANVEGLLESPLLHDDDLKARIETAGVIPSLPPPGDEDPALSKEAIARVVKRNKQAVQKCYERALIKKPTLAGKLVIEFTIEGNGHVSNVNSAEASTLTDAAVSSCVMDSMSKLTFPATSDGQSVTVAYPFVFAPAQ